MLRDAFESFKRVTKPCFYAHLKPIKELSKNAARCFWKQYRKLSKMVIIHIYKCVKSKVSVSQYAPDYKQKDKYNVTDIRLKVNKKIEK